MIPEKMDRKAKKMKTRNGQMSESLRLGILLAIVGGFLEAYTFFCRGGVFANCQTGNLVMFALSAADGDGENMILYLIPVVAFVVGIFLAEWIRQLFSQYQKIHWRQIIILFEIVCLAVTAFIPGGKLDVVVTTVIAFVCSMQVESFRKVRGKAFATTMCTGNLRSASENLYHWMVGRNKEAKEKGGHYLIIVGSFMGGAVLGATLTHIFIEKAVLFCCVILFLTFLFMFCQESGTIKRENVCD